MTPLPRTFSQGSAVPVLEVADLTVTYELRGVRAAAVTGVSLAVEAGESYGLVGESGCGKSTLAFALMRYLPPNGRIERGSVRIAGEELLTLPPATLRQWRGARLAMVYQDPAAALNPCLRVGRQVAEVFQFHEGLGRNEAMNRAAEALEQVALPNPAGLLRRYPYELSGGQQQRVVIAMALAGNPQLLILDEPTTGLDATVEAEILELIDHLRTELGKAVLLITHNLGIVARVCQRVSVLYAGRVVEDGFSHELFSSPKHPYTADLIRCVPRLGMNKTGSRLDPIPGSLPALGSHLPGCYYESRCSSAKERCHELEPQLERVSNLHTSRCFYASEVGPVTLPDGVLPQEGAEVGGLPLLRVEGLSKSYREGLRRLPAVDDVSLTIGRGETVGLVGESGSGKTTLARCIVGLLAADDGVLYLSGDVLPLRLSKRRRQDLQSIRMVFQNPDASLNPRASAKQILGRSVRLLRGLHGSAVEARVEDLAKEVRLSNENLKVRSSELSGGQKQRVAVARAFAGRPSLVVCDEPVSAMDVSVQAAILNLLAQLQVSEFVSYLFISHDLGVVRYLADRIGVMYLGQIVELVPASHVFVPPHHPYTEALLSAIPTLDLTSRRERIHLRGAVPSLTNLPSGCRFHTRCPRKLGSVCESESPPWREIGNNHFSRCHIVGEQLQRLQSAEAGP